MLQQDVVLYMGKAVFGSSPKRKLLYVKLTEAIALVYFLNEVFFTGR